MHIKETIIINRSPEEVYAFWHVYEDFPSFMLDLESVSQSGPKLLHFKTKPFGGESDEWDAEIIIEVPFSEIAWRSIKGAKVENSGSVRFEPATGGRGTVVRLECDLTLPTTEAIKAKIGKIFGEDPAQSFKKILRASKQILETGGIVISEASISPGHPAQPPSDSELPLVQREYHRLYPVIAEQ